MELISSREADAQYASIEVSDLLTTSPPPGHAMKADDPFKAFEAVIGKALRPLKEGQDVIPILVALQERAEPLEEEEECQMSLSAFRLDTITCKNPRGKIPEMISSRLAFTAIKSNVDAEPTSSLTWRHPVRVLPVTCQHKR